MASNRSLGVTIALDTIATSTMLVDPLVSVEGDPGTAAMGGAVPGSAAALRPRHQPVKPLLRSAK